jgi:hypothetical protein
MQSSAHTLVSMMQATLLRDQIHGLTSPMSDEAKPSMASLPTKSSLDFVNPSFRGNSLPLTVGTSTPTAFLKLLPSVTLRVTAYSDQQNVFRIMW